MRWRGRQGSSNVKDMRGKQIGVGLGAGSIIIALVVYLLGGDPGEVLDQVNTGAPQGQYQPTAEEEEAAQFVSVVLKDTEDVWDEQMQLQLQKNYVHPQLVLFSGAVQSACGRAGAATGPFYCPPDHSIYIDLSFYNDLKNKFGAPGDFAMAYVVAHEVGHHIQKLLGITDQLHSARGRVNQEEYNQMSVRHELQADFLAGVWAHHADRMKNILEPGDIEEALNAANAIGDDRLQRQSGGVVVPESFTHGTSAQRMKWFKLGYDTGDLSYGDTFNVSDL
jgi:uncharacterized protein